MADPLSILGAALGVTSLILQVTDECIKGFKFYNEAANMPDTYRYLRVRVQIEQQRFLNFGLEAGLLYADGIICGTLQVNRSVLLAVLAEIKTLLESYATANGKYEGLLDQGNIDWDDGREPDTGLIDYLCQQPDSKKEDSPEDLAKKKKVHLKHLRDFGKSVVQTGRKLRTIIVEPKRLVWAAVDKESFERLALKVGDLNSFLIALLDSSQISRLQATMDTSYSEILQIRNDVESLTILVKALALPGDGRHNAQVGTAGSESSPLAQTVAQETENQKKGYFKQLAEVKIQHTRVDQLIKDVSTSPTSSKLVSTSLKLSGFQFPAGLVDFDNLLQRTNATYQEDGVWIEWKDIPASHSFLLRTEQVENRIGLLTDLLRYQKPDGFRAPPCLGYLKLTDKERNTRFGFVFKKPPRAESELLTLRDLVGNRPMPSLSARISLCAVLARCIHSFHAVNWLHKGLRSDNIIFFTSSSVGLELSAPYVSGFELSRPSNVENLTEKPNFKPEEDIYRHPNAQSSQIDGNYRKSYDIYSLGVIFIEVAFWKRIEDIIGFENLARVKQSALREVQSWLLGRPCRPNIALPPISTDTGPCLQQIAPVCGDAFRDVVECCLTADIVEKPEYAGESATSIALRLQKVTEEKIGKRLEHIAGVLQ